ncbi:MAG: BamA/TamA family outer membrane protein [Saprospiraceae bacterium]
MPIRNIGVHSTQVAKQQPLFSKRWVATAVVAYLLLVLVSSSGCSIQQHLDKSKPLYDGSAIRITNSEVVPDEKDLERELVKQVQQERVGQIAMWWWFKLDTPKEKGVKKWLQKTLGQPPSYYKPSKSNLTFLLMQDYLKDHGFFGASIRQDTTHPDTYRILDSFVIVAVPRARIDTIVWPLDSSAFGAFLDREKPKSYLKEGDFYSISTLDAERLRLDQLSARQGFYEFAKSNLFYIVDSTAAPGKVAIYMRLSKGSDSLAFSQFGIGETYVYPNYSRLADYDGPETDSVELNDLKIIQHSVVAIKPKVLDRRIGLRSGAVYNLQLYENTLNQLLDLGVYKYVNYEFKRRMTDSTPVLDQYIYLTQGTTKEFSSNLEATTRTGALLGLGASGSYSDKNLFNGAEDFTVSLSAAAGPQTSIADATKTIIAREFGLSAELALPRFMGPFRKYIARTAYYIPRTIFSARYQLLDRPDFGLQTISFRLGYRYRANRFVTHELYPLSINYNRVISASPEFNQALDESDRLKQSFSDNAVLGLEYIFRYSDQQISGARSYWFIEGGIKSAGNVASLLAGEPSSPTLPRDFLGVQISQFFRAHVDVRRTFNFRTSSLASRVYLGAAIPFGNSDVVPYADQFFAGGPNSVRAFQIRGLGPGSSLPATQSSTSSLNQTGDIRLELNTEYRFPIWSFFEGAAFADAGNVWLYNDVDNDTPEGLFAVDEFYKQIAVGTGIGMRVILDFLILRVDASVPIYKPWLIQTNPWDFGALNIFDAASRQENLQFHIAIGYPF